MMPKFIVKATAYDFYCAIVEAKDAQEAYEIARNNDVDWQKEVEGDWQVHGGLTEEITDEDIV